MVKIRIPSLNGPRTVSGKITRSFPDGRIEVKTQNDGYFIVPRREIFDSAVARIAERNHVR